MLVNLDCFPQSKSELNAQVSALQNEKSRLDKENDDLNHQVYILKEELEKVKAQNEDLKVALNEAKQKAESSSTNSVYSGTSNPSSNNQCLATTSKGTRCTRKPDSGSNYCWQHKTTYEPNKENVSTPSTTSGSGGRTIYTGPRGGKYYINSKGKKTYIKR